MCGRIPRRGGAGLRTRDGRRGGGGALANGGSANVVLAAGGPASHQRAGVDLRRRRVRNERRAGPRATHVRRMMSSVTSTSARARTRRPDYRRPAVGPRRPDGGSARRHWIDVAARASFEPIMLARFRMCAAAEHFDAVEPEQTWKRSRNATGSSDHAPTEQLACNESVAPPRRRARHGCPPEERIPGSPGSSALLRQDAGRRNADRWHEYGLFRTTFAPASPVLNAEYKLATSRFCAYDEAAGIVGRALRPRARRPALRTVLEPLQPGRLVVASRACSAGVPAVGVLEQRAAPLPPG